jgi:hypothetical protein
MVGFFIALCKYRVFSIIFCIFFRNLQKISVNAFIEQFYEELFFVFSSGIFKKYLLMLSLNSFMKMD